MLADAGASASSQFILVDAKQLEVPGLQRRLDVADLDLLGLLLISSMGWAPVGQ